MTEMAKVAVLLCGYGEVEEYEEFANYNERALRLLASKFIKFPEFSIPWLAKALEFTDRREWSKQDHYHSPHNEIFEAQRAGLERVLQQRYGDRVAVFKAFNFCEPFLPHQVLQQIREQGYTRLLIYPLLVVDSVYTSGLALQQINEALGDDHDWIEDLRYLPSFYERPEYHQCMADHIEGRLQDLQGNYARTQIGIILLNHGCPVDSKGFESGIRESEALYSSIRERLIHRYPLVSIGWMNHDTPGQWTTPDMELAATNLLTTGAKALAFAPIGFATENHETMLDVGYAIKKFQSKAECLHLDCLNDDPAFLQVAANWVDRLIGELLSEEQPSLQTVPTYSVNEFQTPNRNRELHKVLAGNGHHHHSHGHSHGPGGHHHHHH
ncbi:MAG: ferrochelatase [Cyanobacteria bacterium J06642_2]